MRCNMTVGIDARRILFFGPRRSKNRPLGVRGTERNSQRGIYYFIINTVKNIAANKD